ncbi:synaptonemal complex protein 1-like isoform X2 [Coccinella septempunctata]|uniref:synaptonemal complex protein 1-like isoform X2 n=1 Tax=Coccinella septempunctata TaxID=41139 RepID=UPI001D0743F9|nr:synaptonemal complex protein 1-like isoform X2 [Coccinella septempunctata]
MSGYEIVVRGRRFPFKARLVFQNEHLEKWSSSSISTDSAIYTRQCLKKRNYYFPQYSNYNETIWNYTKCTQSTPQKPRSKLMLKSFPNSPKYDEEIKLFKKPYRMAPKSKIVEGDTLAEIGIDKQPVMEENNIIEEIDNFLSNVEPVKSNTARSLDFAGCENSHPSKTAVDVHQLLKEMDKQEEKIKNMCDNKTGTISSNSSEKNTGYQTPMEWRKGIETFSTSSTDSSSFTDKSTVLYQPTGKKTESMTIAENEKNRDPPLYGYLNHALIENNIERKTSNNSNLHTDRTMTENYSTSSNFTKRSISSPQCDIHSNAKETLTVHQKLLDQTHSPEFSSFHDPTRKLMRPVSDQRLGSLSLINLWKNEKKEVETSSDKCIQRLQEEKLRRTHCEELIQQLQNKILEQQEKLAVAIQVDEAKDNAILKFHDAWEKASVKFKMVVRERDQLEKDVERLAIQNKKVAEESEERIEFHRNETKQALNIVHECKTKLEQLDKKFEELRVENEALKCANRELEERLSSEGEKNNQLSNILANKELELNESKNILLHAKKEVSQCQAAVEMCQKDFSTIKTEYDLIQEEIKAERQNVSQLHEQNKVLHEELEGRKKKEESLMENLAELQAKLDSNKKELRNFYQGQVELLVQNKLKEFQAQLDEAEQKMKEQLEKKELEIAKSAALHIQQINDKYTLEINLIEQKHQEEMQLKQVKIAQLDQRLYEMQTNYERQQDKKSDLLKQLQKVMEAQWTEALRILNNGRSPAPQEDSSSTMDQLHSLQSKSYQNMEALLSQEFEDKSRNQHYVHNGKEGYHQNQQSDKRNHHRKEGHGQRSSVASRSRGGRQQDDGHLQRYINLLLHKQPGNPAESKEKQSPQKYHSEQPTTDASMWQSATGSTQYVPDLLENQNQKEINRRKTSWK